MERQNPAGIATTAAVAVETATSTTCCAIEPRELGRVRLPEMQQLAHDIAAARGASAHRVEQHLDAGIWGTRDSGGSVADDERAGVDDADPPGECEGFGHIMRDEDHRRLPAAAESA